MTAPRGVCEPPASIIDADTKSRMNVLSLILRLNDRLSRQFCVGNRNGSSILSLKPCEVLGDPLGGPDCSVITAQNTLCLRPEFNLIDFTARPYINPLTLSSASLWSRSFSSCTSSLKSEWVAASRSLHRL